MPLAIALLLVWLILTVKFPRVMLPATGVLVLIAGLLAGGAALWQWQERQRVEQIVFDIRFDPVACSLAQPIRVRIDNQTGRTARQIHWQLHAVQPGYSTNLVDASRDAATYRTERPLAAGEQFEQCLTVPRLRSGYRARDLQYRSDRVSADFN